MMNYDVNAILARYNESQQNDIIRTIKLCSIAHIGTVPATEEEFIRFCDDIAFPDRWKEEKQKKETAKKAAKAEKLGISLERYEEIERTKRAISSPKSRIKKAAAEIKQLTADIERMTAQLEELEEKLATMV